MTENQCVCQYAYMSLSIHTSPYVQYSWRNVCVLIRVWIMDGRVLIIWTVESKHCKQSFYHHAAPYALPCYTLALTVGNK